MSEDTEKIEINEPSRQKYKWKNIAYYNTFEEAHDHRIKINFTNLDENNPPRVKVRRCGPDQSRFVVKVGTPVDGE